MNFGFSYIGLIFLLMLFVPNIIFTKNIPADYEKYSANENKALLIPERLGQAAVTVISVIFADFNPRVSARLPLLAAALIIMLMYEFFWIRYFRSEKTMRDFYGQLWGIPLPGAVLPVAAFLLLGIYGRNYPMIISVICLGIGHIGIHAQHFKESESDEND